MKILQRLLALLNPSTALCPRRRANTLVCASRVSIPSPPPPPANYLSTIADRLRVHHPVA